MVSRQAISPPLADPRSRDDGLAHFCFTRKDLIMLAADHDPNSPKSQFSILEKPVSLIVYFMRNSTFFLAVARIFSKRGESGNGRSSVPASSARAYGRGPGPLCGLGKARDRACHPCAGTGSRRWRSSCRCRSRRSRLRADASRLRHYGQDKQTGRFLQAVSCPSAPKTLRLKLVVLLASDFLAAEI